MTIANSNNRTRLAVSGTTYDFTFKIDADTEILVYGIDSDGVATLLTLTTNYTVSISAVTEGGTVTLLGGIESSYAEILMVRNKSYIQSADIPTRGGFNEAVIEGALDDLEMQIQQLKELTDYSLKQSSTAVAINVVLPEPADGEILAWDGTSGAMQNIAQADFTGPTGPTGATGPAGADGIFSAIASQAEAEAGIENTKGMTALRVAQAIAALGLSHVNTGIFTRDISTTGDQAITGVGFTPKLVIIFSSVDLLSGSWGAWDGTTSVNTEMAKGDTFENISQTADKLIHLYVNTTTAAYATGKTFDADGFTITWAKGGSPTGTAHMAYIAIG